MLYNRTSSKKSSGGSPKQIISSLSEKYVENIGTHTKGQDRGARNG